MDIRLDAYGIDKLIIFPGMLGLFIISFYTVLTLMFFQVLKINRLYSILVNFILYAASFVLGYLYFLFFIYVGMDTVRFHSNNLVLVYIYTIIINLLPILLLIYTIIQLKRNKSIFNNIIVMIIITILSYVMLSVVFPIDERYIIEGLFFPSIESSIGTFVLSFSSFLNNICKKQN